MQKGFITLGPVLKFYYSIGTSAVPALNIFDKYFGFREFKNLYLCTGNETLDNVR
jgi:hypothetical protein